MQICPGVLPLVRDVAYPAEFNQRHNEKLASGKTLTTCKFPFGICKFRVGLA